MPILTKQSDKPNNQFYTPFLRMKMGYVAALPFIGPLILMLLALQVSDPEGPEGLLILVPGLALVAGGYLAYTSWGFRFSRRLRPRLQAKVEADCGVKLEGLPMVGISPGIETRVYNGDTCCDVGFLSIEAGRIRYFGDTLNFELRPQQVTKVEINRMNILGGRYTRTSVTWNAGPEAKDEVLMFECWDAGSSQDLHRLAVELKDRLEAWRQTNGSDEPEQTLGLPPTPGDIKALYSPSHTQTGCSSVLLAGLFSFVLWMAFMLSAESLFGEKTARNPLIPACGLLGTVAVFALLSGLLRKWIGRK